MLEADDCRAMWAALECGQSRTIDDITLIAEVLPRVQLPYLNALVRHGYASMVGIHFTGSGQAVPSFRLINRTGPLAPTIAEDGTLHDPNLEPKVEQKPAKPRAKGEFPTFSARMRMAAERIGEPFTRKALISAMHRELSFDRRSFEYGWHGLVSRGVFKAVEDHEGYYTYACPALTAGIRKYFLEHIGETLNVKVIPTEHTGTKAGNHIRAALDLIAAEGYAVHVIKLKPWKRGGAVAYRVDQQPLFIGLSTENGVPELTFSDKFGRPYEDEGDQIPPNSPV